MENKSAGPGNVLTGFRVFGGYQRQRSVLQLKWKFFKNLYPDLLDCLLLYPQQRGGFFSAVFPRTREAADQKGEAWG